MDITDLLRYAVEMGASDSHVKAGNVPFVRVDGELRPSSFPMTPGQTGGGLPHDFVLALRGVLARGAPTLSP
jgi:Tfp pilus assembly pilus retraction ATPase PilT